MSKSRKNKQVEVVFEPDLEFITKSNSKPEPKVEVITGKVNSKTGLYVRNQPNKTIGKPIKVLSYEAEIIILKEINGWAKIAEGQYVDLTYIDKV